MLPLASMSTPVAPLHAVTPSGKVAQLPTNRYDPLSAAARVTSNDVSASAATKTAIHTRVMTIPVLSHVACRGDPTPSDVARGVSRAGRVDRFGGLTDG